MKGPTALLLLTLALAGCQQEMADQPSYKPLRPAPFFADGRSERPWCPARSPADTCGPTLRYTPAERPGARRVPRSRRSNPNSPTPKAKTKRNTPISWILSLPDDGEGLGARLQLLHDLLRDVPRPAGHRAGKDRGTRLHAPALVSYRALAEAPVGHLFAVISEGYGSMPAYAAQIPVRDRWAIVGYLRALQASQHFPESQLSEKMRDKRSRQNESPAPAGRRAMSTTASLNRDAAARWQRLLLGIGLLACWPASSAPASAPRSFSAPGWRPTCSTWGSRSAQFWETRLRMPPRKLCI